MGELNSSNLPHTFDGFRCHNLSCYWPTLDSIQSDSHEPAMTHAAVEQRDMIIEVAAGAGGSPAMWIAIGSKDGGARRYFCFFRLGTQRETHREGPSIRVHYQIPIELGFTGLALQRTIYFSNLIIRKCLGFRCCSLLTSKTYIKCISALRLGPGS